MLQFDTAHVFLLLFHNNYGPTLHHLTHIAKQWLKIIQFIYPTCIQCPHRGRLISQICLVLGKLDWLNYYTLKKVWYVKPFRYSTGAWQTDRHTDRRKDGHNCHTIIARQHCYADAR